MRNESGVTFLELMVVIGIMAILASIAIPGFLGWLPQYRMRSAADEVLSTLQHAKLRAIRENDIVSVRFDFATDRYTAFLDNGAGAAAGNGTQDAGEVTVKNGQMPAGIDLQSSTFGPVVQFNRRGFPDANGDIVVANGPNTRTINLTLGGSSSIQ
jgi:prepilin-type N-terminal cleavage/methylation domain-containing protein